MTKLEIAEALSAKIEALTTTSISQRRTHANDAYSLLRKLVAIVPPATAQETAANAYEDGVHWTLATVRDVGFDTARSLQRVLDRGGEPAVGELSGAANSMRNYAERIINTAESLANTHLRERLKAKETT
jgi:hypothetical protein